MSVVGREAECALELLRAAVVFGCCDTRPVVAEPDMTVNVGGRVVAVCRWGSRSGFPVVGLHGAPGCRLNAVPDASVLTRFDYVTYDRPGYGRSTRHPGRAVA